MILLSIVLSCGDKKSPATNSTPEQFNNDTGAQHVNVEDTSTEDANVTDTGWNDIDDPHENCTNNDNNNNFENATKPIIGTWELYGPTFQTETCSGNHSYSYTRFMEVDLSGESLRFMIGWGPDQMTFNCVYEDWSYTCTDVVVENILPTGGTLYHRHQLSGLFDSATSLTGNYTIITTCEGDTGCSQEDLGFVVPCEQSGTVSASLYE